MRGWKVCLFVFLLFVPSVSSAFCFESAGRRYDVSPELLRAIAMVESGMDPHAVNVRNRDGSKDYGLMQVNSFWSRSLGETWAYIMEPCYNVHVGAWILSQCIDRYGYSWKAVGCYHRGRWDGLAKRYVRRVQDALAEIYLD